MENIIIIGFVVSAAGQIAIAVALYHMAERRFSNGVAWSIIGLLFGVLGLIAFLMFLIWAESVDNIKEYNEAQRISRFLTQHRQDQELRHQATQSPYVDFYLDELLASGQWETATQYLTEKLRLAHEMGDSHREGLYRQRLTEIQAQRDGPA